MAARMAAVVAMLAVSHGAQELIKNPGLERLGDWDCWSIHCELSSDHHGGSHSLKATQRTMYYQGPSQYVTVKEGHVYKVQAWVKFVNDNGQLQHIDVMAEHQQNNGHSQYDTICGRTSMTVHTGWALVSGEMVVPTLGLKKSRLYFQGPEPGIGFMIDDVSVTEIQINDQNWKAEANARIDKLRKNNIHVKVTTGSGVDSGAVSIEINQKNHLFPFGVAFSADLVANNNGGSDQKYRQFIFDNYNWATPGNALKWTQIERQQGHPDFTMGTNAIKRLRSQGLKVRGHNLLWGVSEQFSPGWLVKLPPTQIDSEVHRHIQQTVTHYKGLVEHWDVNNELLHGQFFENKLHDPDYTKKIFRLAHQYDHNVTLFLNDYGVVASGGYTQSYLEQAKAFKAAHTHIGAIGAQCHFASPPIPTLIKQRVDLLAQAGLPIWATEVDVYSDDVNQRADYYETIYRVLFSHPSIEGIIMWGFWSQRHWLGEKAALVSGQEFTVNAAGHRYINLTQKEWWTTDSRKLAGHGYTVRGFHGDYEVKVKVNGHVVQTKQFSLGKSDYNLNLHVTA